MGATGTADATVQSNVGLAVGRTRDNERIGFIIGAPGRSDRRVLVASRLAGSVSEIDVRATVLYLRSGPVVADGAAEPSLLGARPVNVAVLQLSTEPPAEMVPLQLSELGAEAVFPLPCDVLDPVQPNGALAGHILRCEDGLVQVEIRSLGPEAAARLAGAPVVVRAPEAMAPIVVAVVDPAVTSAVAQPDLPGARILSAWSASSLAAAMPELSPFVMSRGARLFVHGDRLIGELNSGGAEAMAVTCHDAAAAALMFQAHPQLVDCLWQGEQLRLNLRHWLRERLDASVVSDLEAIGSARADYRQVALVAALDPEVTPRFGSLQLDGPGIRRIAADALAANRSFLASERTLEQLYESGVLRAASTATGRKDLADVQQGWERAVGSYATRLRDLELVGAGTYGLQEHRGEVLALALLVALGAKACPAHPGGRGANACGSCSLLSRAASLTPEQVGQLLTVVPVGAALRGAVSQVRKAREEKAALSARLPQLEQTVGQLRHELDKSNRELEQERQGRRGDIERLQRQLHGAAEMQRRAAQSDATRRDVLVALIVALAAVLGLAFLWFDDRRWHFIFLTILAALALGLVALLRQRGASSSSGP